MKRRSAAPEPEPSSKPGDLTQQLSLPVPPPAPRDPPPQPAAAAAAPSPEPAAPSPPESMAEPAPPASLPPEAAQAVEPGPPRPLLDEEDVRRLLDPPGRRPAHPAPAPEPRLTVDPDEREAAVPPAPAELRLVVDAPEPTAPAAPPEAQAPRAGAASPAAPAPGSIDEIIDYWDGLRGSRPVPPLDVLDRGKVGRSWPNCLLVAFGAADTVTPKLTRLGEENGEIEYSEMVIHWILSRGRLAARNGEPMEEEKRFPVTGGGNARYQLLLLPLATPEGRSEHVLCHLNRVKEVAKGGFKRWLAS
ncbi:MAG TPA: hypothetical protein VF502_11200 [Stellaceae bacterium]